MYKDKQKSNILDENINKYKDIWDKINELAFVMEANEVFVPKCFIDANNKFYSHLGYSKKNFIKEAPSNILIFDKNETGLELYRNLMYKKRHNVEMILRSKDKKHIYVKANIILFVSNKKNYILTIATDITKNKRLEKELNGILNGIPDVIKVYNPDYTIAFLNEAGYGFYNKILQEVHGNTCYEVLSRKEKCLECSLDEVIETKQMITKERYIPELNTFMDTITIQYLMKMGRYYL